MDTIAGVHIRFESVERWGLRGFVRRPAAPEARRRLVSESEPTPDASAIFLAILLCTPTVSPYCSKNASSLVLPSRL
jgi:hypothetical protein